MVAKTFQVQVGDIAIHVESELGEAAGEFAELYAGFRQPEQPIVPPIRMVVKRQPRSRLGAKRYAIFGDGVEVFRHRSREEIVPYLEWGINRRVVSLCSNYLQIHAASMACSGQGIIFAGNSGSGKSTLAAALLSRGWGYLCDEFALIDPATLRVHPFPKALCIKAGSFDVVEKLGLPLSKRRYYVKAFKRRVGYIGSRGQGATPFAGPTTIKAVVFPQYSRGNEPRMFPIPRAKAAFALTGLVLNRPAFGSTAGRIVSALVRNVPCFGLECGPILETCDLVQNLVHSRKSLRCCGNLS